MPIFLVRHGKTVDHQKETRQSPDSILGEIGIEQATKLAVRLQKEGIESIVSSPWPRALQTAQITAEALGLPVQTEERLCEQRTNPIVDLLPMNDPKNIEYLDHIFKFGRSDSNWKYGDKGESMQELIDRALEVKQFLIEKYNDKTILVVSHGAFLSALCTVFLFEEKVDHKALWKLSFAFRGQSNTGLTKLEMEEFRGEWILKFFNDTRHLG